MTEKKKINDDTLSMISGGTAQELAELKQAILDNPTLAKDWTWFEKEAEEMGRKGDEIYIINRILSMDFDEVATLSTTEENRYFWADQHEEMLRQIREYKG